MTPAVSVLDRAWLSDQLVLASRLYPKATRQVLGVLWWYSASTVLLGPAVSGDDPALDAITLNLLPDGRLVDAKSVPFDGDPGPRLRGMLVASISAVAAVSGARERQLWAIATDSLSNRCLWVNQPSLALDLAADIPELPVPRFVSVRGRLFTRRVSCCLIYQGTDTPKCVSCPRQTPEARMARLIQQVG
ncbi:(2Fe-2S)-binding protein [Actinocrispum sp. NPDC049592]|uniref:(2Fe-2S)-binding protein n=1 Tax=Actinocrispum sp. NPDC049592 TaxID=3154835 RepID=UPI0034420DC9